MVIFYHSTSRISLLLLFHESKTSVNNRDILGVYCDVTGTCVACSLCNSNFYKQVFTTRRISYSIARIYCENKYLWITPSCYQKKHLRFLIITYIHSRRYNFKNPWLEIYKSYLIKILLRYRAILGKFWVKLSDSYPVANESCVALKLKNSMCADGGFSQIWSHIEDTYIRTSKNACWL